LWIEVWDTGPGIAAPELERIFDDFFRVDATARGQQGVGLGLGVVERMAKSLGHPIEVHSVVGKGSCFRVAVPMLSSNWQSATSAAEPMPLIYQHSGYQLLCVDDDETNLSALSTLLRQWQLGDITVCNGENQVHEFMAAKIRPDLVIIDYQLGHGIDGIQLYQQMLKSWPSVPGVLVSAASEPDLPAKAKAAGMLFLAKPIKPAALRASLNYLKIVAKH
jgi:CheY-like chemotaxis protein